MKAQDFLAWTKATGLTTARQAYEELGASRNLVQQWYADAEAGKDVTIKRHVALAMTAIAQGLKPWDEYER
ncbi:hypothetical protein KBY27_01285 [Ruegeria pomeroyi]|uniref:Uncharacterized protein n=1 Tax=Ruegeria pomeroyi TaxID=89184 RepID=A0A9Q3WIL2_9RHOB|nr:hypothetical protein [Ruegeria pomeroyi]MCE8536082.1 hypothetical protein [Ruegeria pomeroyi]